MNLGLCLRSMWRYLFIRTVQSCQHFDPAHVSLQWMVSVSHPLNIDGWCLFNDTRCHRVQIMDWSLPVGGPMHWWRVSLEPAGQEMNGLPSMRSRVRRGQ